MNAAVQEHMPLAVGDIDRSTYLGSSDIAPILGVDPYDRTPLTVYLQKIGELAGITDPERIKFLKRRKRWEGPIVQMLREEFDGEIVAVNQRYRDPAHPFLAAEIDFEWRDADGSIQNGEIKTVSPFAFGERYGWGAEGTDEIPVHYHAQVMYGLGRTGRRKTVVAAMSGLDNMHFYVAHRDDEIIDGMTATAVAFWKKVQARTPPDPISMTDVMRLYDRRRGRPVELTEEMATALQNLRTCRAALKAHKDDADALELEIAKYVCAQWNIDAAEPTTDAATLLYQGQKLATWAAGRGAHLDQSRLKTDHPKLVADYTVPHYFRSFRFPKT